MGELMRPQPRRSWGEHALAVARWIGVGRIVGGALAIVAVVGGAFWLLQPDDGPEAVGPTSVEAVRPPTVSAVSDPPATEPPASTAPSTVVVHVAGAVVAPGVYELAAGSRVADGLDAAGGAASDAVLDAVNLAAPLVDGAQVYVPHTGEASGPATAAPTGGVPTPTNPIDINAATEEELESLPGIGPVTAGAIVRHREESGPFASVDGLMDVPGIGPARLASLQGLIRV